MQHKPILTPEDENDVSSRVKGCMSKCILLEDSHKNIYLFITPANTKIDIKEIGRVLVKDKLKIQDSKALKDIEKVFIDSLSVFNIIIDKNLSRHKFVSFQLVSKDATDTISYEDMIRFIELHECPILYF